MADPTPPTSGNPPIRPGDPIPTGGIDPTQVFSSPPPPPPQSGGQQGDDDAAIPQDAGPPPPPVGTPVATDDDKNKLKEMGYDDEDIRVLGEVGNYRFGSVMSSLSNENIRMPAHDQTAFDNEKFLVLLRGSISLTRDEKWRIIQAVPRLSQFQVDELQKILEEERRKFGELSPKHLMQLMKLEQKHADDWRDLQTIASQQDVRAQEVDEAEQIRKNLGLS